MAQMVTRLLEDLDTIEAMAERSGWSEDLKELQKVVCSEIDELINAV